MTNLASENAARKLQALVLIPFFLAFPFGLYGALVGLIINCTVLIFNKQNEIFIKNRIERLYFLIGSLISVFAGINISERKWLVYLLALILFGYVIYLLKYYRFYKSNTGGQI